MMQKDHLEDGPQPGALTVSVNTTSIQALLGTFIPIMSYYTLNNHTFVLDYEEKKVLYSLKLKDIHINTVTGFKEKIFEEIPGTDKVHFRLGGIDVDMDVNGEIDALRFIPLKASKVLLNNLTIDFVLESTSDDKVHWKLSDVTTVTVHNVTIDMKSKFWNFVVKETSGLINKIIKNQLKNIGKLVDKKIDELNKLVAGEGPYTFVTTMFKHDFPLNLTLPAAPTVADDIITINFDGHFVEPQPNGTYSSVMNSTVVPDFPPRIPNSLRQQLWIHEDMLNSFMRISDGILFPITISSQNVSDAFKKDIPELKEYFGDKSNISMQLSFIPTSEHQDPFQIKRDRGIVFGDLENIVSKIEIFGTNDTTEEELAASFKMNLEASGNLTMLNFVMYPKFDLIQVANVFKVNDYIGLQEKDFNTLFGAMLNTYANNFNDEYLKGWSLSNIDPQLGLLTGILKNTTLTPYVTDEWLFGGFSMQPDMTDMPTLEFIQ